METQEGAATSAVAIAAATAAGAEAGDQSRELAHVDQAAAQAKAAELIKLSIPKLTAALGELSLVELRALLAAEEGEGEGKTRAGALEAIGDAIDKHPDQVAALAQAAPAVNEQGAEGAAAETPATMADSGEGPVDGGPVTLEGGEAFAAAAMDATGGAGVHDDAQMRAAMDAPLSASDAIAAAVAGADVDAGVVAALEDAGVRVLRLDDECAEWDNAEVLAHVLEAGAIIIIARHDFAHPELEPIRATPDQFVRAHDGQRVLFTGDISLSGVGLREPLPLEEAWLVIPSDGEPTIVRRCEVPGALYLEPGRIVAFRPRTLIF